MTMKNILARIKSRFHFTRQTPVINPYVEGNAGRKEWNDRYGNMASQLQHWRLAFGVAMGVMVIFAVSMMFMALSIKIKPFVVETHEGLPYAIKPMESVSLHDQRLINYAVNQFITQARTIVQDPEAQKTLLNKVFAFSADSTLGFLHDYYKNYNPLELANQYTVSVHIINSLPISQNIWQILWEETKRKSQDNQLLEVSHWIAHVTVKQGDVNPEFINDNPFGIFISHLTWSQNQTGG
jgi:type IV secretory pathway TrbF-like protein